MQLGATTSSLLALLPALSLQESFNVDLLGRLDPYTLYSDVWGYRTSDGREYALVAANIGTSVVDCTDPTQPVERGLIPGAITSLRDIKTYGPYAYVVNENSGGLQIIDLTDPDNPTLANTWGASAFTHSHNVAIDQDTGWIYAVGTDVGTVIFDASVDPLEPPLVGVYGSPVITEYVHDLHVQDGVGHAAMVWTGEYRLLDVTTWPFPTIAAPRTAGGASHNCWANATNTVTVTTDEQEAGLVQLWDVADPTAPSPLAAYSPNTLSIPHNAFLVDGVCHVAWYTEGYHVLDVVDPTRPEPLGYYDMHTGPDGMQLGAFGCYPFQPSGAVYVSDRTDGLFVFRPHRLHIRHEPLGDTENEARPHRVRANIRAEAPIRSATLFWSLDGEVFHEQAMRPPQSDLDFGAAGTSGRYTAAIPAQAAPARISYFLTATDHGGGRARSPAAGGRHTFHVGPTTRVFFDDFEGASSWTHGGTNDDWELGPPQGMGGTSRGVAWVDPWSAYSGANVWGNDLGLAGSNGAYETNTSNWLQSAPIPTLGVQGLRLRLRRWLTVEDSANDRARIRVNGQLVWQSPAQHLLDFEWTELDLDVSSITDSASTATLRFELVTDGDMEIGGWQVDDVELYSRANEVSSFGD